MVYEDSKIIDCKAPHRPTDMTSEYVAAVDSVVGSWLKTWRHDVQLESVSSFLAEQPTQVASVTNVC